MAVISHGIGLNHNDFHRCACGTALKSNTLPESFGSAIGLCWALELHTGYIHCKVGNSRYNPQCTVPPDSFDSARLTGKLISNSQQWQVWKYHCENTIAPDSFRQCNCFYTFMFSWKSISMNTSNQYFVSKDMMALIFTIWSVLSHQWHWCSPLDQ